MVDRATSRLLVYNAAAATVWRAWSRSASVADAAKQLGMTFGIDAGRAHRDVEAILEHWRSEGLFDTATPLAPGSDTVEWQARDKVYAGRWTCQISGLTIEFAIEKSDRVAQVRTLLQLFETEGSPTRPADLSIALREVEGGATALIVDGLERVRAAKGETLKDAVHDVLIERIHPRARVLALAHAGCVAKNDIAVGFPADSGGGKTTLIAYLAAHGFTYISDDLLPIAEDGIALPWPMPLSVKSGSLAVLGPIYPHLAEARSFRTKGDTAHLLPPPVMNWDHHVDLRFLVFPKYGPSADAAFDEIGPLDALTRLIQSRIWLGYPLTLDRVTAFLKWLASVRSFACTYSDVKDAAAHVNRIVG